MASVSNTYARAFADVVGTSRLNSGEILQQLRGVAGMIGESADLRRVLENPAIPASQKRGLLDAIVARESISPAVRNFLAILIDHRRVHFLNDIIRQFETEVNLRMGFAEAQVTSARELSAAEKAELEGRIYQMTGKSVKATYAGDASLLGGAVVRIGSTIYDGSVKGQLEKMRERLTGN